MKTGWRALFVSAILLLCANSTAFAHRLDEYLQATTFSVAHDRVDMRLRLAPGVAVAPKVIASIDRDGDGLISEAEQRDYIATVLSDVTVQIDGRTVPLALVSSAFGTTSAMKEGVGEIVLELTAALPAGSSPRTLSFENRHQRAVAAYLVNSLLPTDTLVHIVAQDRSYNQSNYQLRFAVGASTQAQLTATPLLLSEASLDRQDRWAVFRTYFVHGVHHILTGYDHLLFAIGLLLAATTLLELVKVVTAFTIAHSITLALAALGLAHLPEHVVEPIIAASIVFVAVQNMFWPESAHGWSRLAVAFTFGLFHGLAFAGGLLDLMHGMQNTLIVLAIFGFSVGVEVGHQIVLLPLFAALSAARRAQASGKQKSYSQRVRRVGSAGIAVAGAYYLAIALTAAA